MNRQVVNTAHQWVSCGLVLLALKAERALGRGPRALDSSSPLFPTLFCL